MSNYNNIKDIEIIKKIRREDCINYNNFDKQYNIKTAHSIELAPDNSGEYIPVGFDNFNKLYGSNGYQNTPLKTLDDINNFLGKQDNIDSYTFIDFGSGKGRVIFYNLISNAPYKEYIGIEGDKKLHQSALNNLNSINIEINKNITFLNMNLQDYLLYNNPCVYFFYYPCTKEIFDSFITKSIDMVKGSQSYFVFYCETEYNFKEYINKDPIYNYGGVTIYMI